MSLELTASERVPSRAAGLTVTVAVAVTFIALRLVVFDTLIFPLTYVIPLLVCVWTRDRVALWVMVVIFAISHTLKIYVLLPPEILTPDERLANYLATITNLLVGGIVVHAIVGLRLRLEDTLLHLRAQAEELRVQSEELAQQNEELAEQGEELAHQGEELSQQSEELVNQNEELQARTEEVGALNATLLRRETLLQALLESARWNSRETAAFEQLAATARDLCGGAEATAVILEQTGDTLRVRALAGPPGSAGRGAVPDQVSDAFVALALAENRTAALADTTRRPDLALASLPGLMPPTAVVCAPIHAGSTLFGALVVYRPGPYEWTDEDFRLANWLSLQCGQMLHALQVQVEFRDMDRRKSEFLATLSHELRNPLAPISFGLSILESGRHDVEAIRVMRRQLQQLVRLVDDLLDATRLASNKVQIRRARIDVVPLVRQVVEAMKPDVTAAGHSLDVTMPADAVWLDADPDRIGQVVSNLVANAIRYTPSGGHITVRAQLEGESVVLSVSDTGVGLDAADRERVFEMFTQVAGPGSGGLGIGLALVRRIVEQHGGVVEVRSHGRGHGCEFRVTLPQAAAPLSTEHRVAPEDDRPSTPCRVLVVDDNADAAEMMSTLLELHGHQVWIANDGQTALAAAREVVPDAALLDIGLPDVSGYELARWLREDERTKHIRLVAVTGWGQDGDRAKAQAAGFDTHLTKPADPNHILNALRSGS